MNGRFGLKDACGEVLIPALFDDVLYTFADEYRNWVVPVLNDGKIAFVSPDGNGTLVTEFIYDSVNFLAGFYILISDDKQGIATINGQIVVPVEMDDLFEPAVNIDYGCYLLRYNLDLFDNDETCAVAGYNAGFGQVQEWLNDSSLSSDGKTLDNPENIPIEETRDYVKKVENAKEMYTKLYYSNNKSS
jgi:hypothetical protein